MKTLLIIVLSAALGAGACLSRPTEASFKEYLTRNHAAAQTRDTSAKSSKASNTTPREAAPFLDQYTFADRLLWVDVRKDGRIVYTGLFNHWVSHTSERALIEQR